MPKTAENPLPIAAACRLLSGYGTGAGFLLTHDGLVATCAHGVYPGQILRAELSDETLHDARVVAHRPERDLALLKIDGVAGLAHVRLGDPQDYARGSRFFVVGFDQLPESSYAPVYSPAGRRYGAVQGALVLEVGFAGTMQVYADSDEAGAVLDPGFGVVVTTRTEQVRPGYSGAMVCAPDGVVVGLHTAALNLGGFGQEVSAVELSALVASHGHKPARAPRTPQVSRAAGERWSRVFYALQCMEMDRQRIDRGEQAYRDDLDYFDGHPNPMPEEDPEVLLARAYAHRDLEQWAQALALAQTALTRGGISGGWILRNLASYGNGAAIAGFLESQIEAMPDPTRRVVLHTQHLGLLNDRGEFDRATEWGARAEDDAHQARDSAELLLQIARAYHGAGRQEEADTWLFRAVWARDANDLSDAEIARIAADSPEPRTRWYALRKSLNALASGDGGRAALGPLRRLAEAQGAVEAATVFASLERAFADPVPALEPEVTAGETTDDDKDEDAGDGPEEAPDHV